MEKRLSTEAAAEYLGLKPSTLEMWRHKRKGPRYHKIGDRRVVYDLADLESFATARVIETDDSMEIRQRGCE